jgi:chemotaxis receptor (MCP) glutamine deamidase CheD
MKVQDVPMGECIAGCFDAGVDVSMVGSGVAVILVDRERAAFAVGHLGFLDMALDARRKAWLDRLVAAYRNAGGREKRTEASILGGAEFLGGGTLPGFDPEKGTPAAQVASELARRGVSDVETDAGGHRCLTLRLSLRKKGVAINGRPQSAKKAA